MRRCDQQARWVHNHGGSAGDRIAPLPPTH